MDDFDALGFATADLALSAEQCDHLIAALPPVTGGKGGVRNLLDHPTVIALLRHKQLGRLLWSVVGRELVAVKATLFDKTPDSNWRVQWHQDRMVAVHERMAVAGYAQWSTKSGVTHVEPPSAVLEQMIALRLYLDASGPENGPLCVIPGSHRWGKLEEPELVRRAASVAPTEVHVAKGSLLLMRPLLVHSSSPALQPQHRRVLHIELAPAEAISPLRWKTAVAISA